MYYRLGHSPVCFLKPNTSLWLCKEKLCTDQEVHGIDLCILSKFYQNPLINKENINEFVFEMGLPTVVIEQKLISQLIRTAGLQV